MPLKGIKVEGVFSHLAVADQPGHPFTDQQMQRFHDAMEKCSQRVGFRGEIHIANSGALLGNNGLDFGMARPGILLLGSQGKERITAEEIATRTGTINYEVYCTIGKSNRRVYTDS